MWKSQVTLYLYILISNSSLWIIGFHSSYFIQHFIIFPTMLFPLKMVSYVPKTPSQH